MLEQVTLKNYTLTVTGTSRELSHSVTLTGIAQSIIFTANTDSMVVPNPGAKKNSTITLTGVNGLSGNLELGVILSQGVTASVYPRTAFLTFRGTAKATVMLWMPPLSTSSGLGFVRISASASEFGAAVHDLTTVCS